MTASFHFLEPTWFLALIPVGVLLLVLWRSKTSGNAWEKLIEPELLKVLADGQNKERFNAPFLLPAVGFLIAVIALANPVWEKLPQPVFETTNARVVVLDLSLSMYSPDVAPQRLTRAKFKIRDLLKQNYEGQTGLVVFAGDAFVVSPLTRDTGTIASLLDALDPSIMPAQGSRLDRGLEKSMGILSQAGLATAQIIVVTDGYDDELARSVASKALAKGFSVSVLGVGTAEGAPLPNGRGGVIKDRNGKVVLPKVDEDALRQLSQASGGQFSMMTADGRDLSLLSQALPATSAERKKVDDLFADKWKENGPWIAILILPLAALAFRRGWLLSIALLVSVSAPVPGQAFELESLWSNEAQRSQKALEQGDYERALKLAKDPARQGAALYRQGNFEAAEKAFQGQDTATGHYNRGNSLFKQSRFDDAVSAYDKALALEPNMQDALENRALAEQMQQQQKQSSQQNKSSEPQSSEANQEQQSDDASGDDSSEQRQEQSESQASNQEGQSESDAEQQQSQQQESSAQQDEGDRDSGDQDPGPENEPQEQAGSEAEESQQNAEAVEGAGDEPASEEQIAAEQWLKRIPDDPGELLRRKFLLQHQQRNQRN